MWVCKLNKLPSNPGGPGGPRTTVISSSYSFSFPCPNNWLLLLCFGSYDENSQMKNEKQKLLRKIYWNFRGVCVCVCEWIVLCCSIGGNGGDSFMFVGISRRVLIYFSWAVHLCLCIMCFYVSSEMKFEAYVQSGTAIKRNHCTNSVQCWLLATHD